LASSVCPLLHILIDGQVAGQPRKLITHAARTDWPSEQRRTLRRCTVEGEPLY